MLESTNPRCPLLPAFLLSFEILCSVVGNDVVPLVGGRAGDECHHRFGVAHVEHFMRHARFDVDEIAGLIFDHLFEPFTEFVSYSSFDDVQNYFKADMNVRISDTSWWNGGDVGRQACRSHVLARHALFVMDAIPIPLRAAATNREDPAVVFHRADVDFVFDGCHLLLRKKSSIARL